jgi:N-methylhydantoinase B/oxoprolinase/acetone carboxylase alpha subunit
MPQPALLIESESVEVIAPGAPHDEPDQPTAPHVPPAEAEVPITARAHGDAAGSTAARPCSPVPVAAGDRFVIDTPGGGGFGTPST